MLHRQLNSMRVVAYARFRLLPRAGSWDTTSALKDFVRDQGWISSGVCRPCPATDLSIELNGNSWCLMPVRESWFSLSMALDWLSGRTGCCYNFGRLRGWGIVFGRIWTWLVRHHLRWSSLLHHCCLCTIERGYLRERVKQETGTKTRDRIGDQGNRTAWVNTILEQFWSVLDGVKFPDAGSQRTQYWLCHFKATAR